MDKRKTIIVWMDGKKTKVDKNNHANQNNSNQTFPTKEIAATKESNSDVDPIPTYIRQNSLEEETTSNTKKRKVNKTFLHILFSAISAIILGAGLGVFMLNMFTNIDTNTVNGKMNTQTETENNSVGAAADLSTHTLKGLEAFVLQAGLFNDKPNVSLVQEKFSNAGFSTMIWKRDNQYYLFADIAEKKNQTDNEKTAYKELDLETFAKKWTTNGADIEITDAGYKWLVRFRELWIASLTVVSNEKTFSSGEWMKWMESYPEEGEKVDEFYKKVTGLKQAINEANASTAPILLLKLWDHYDNFIITNSNRS